LEVRYINVYHNVRVSPPLVTTNRARNTFSALALLLLYWPAVLSAQGAFSGTWRSNAAKYPVGLGAVAIYTLSSDGTEHFSDNRNRQYDFVIDGKEYPTDRPGSTVAWTKTGQLTWTCLERVQGKLLREIHLVLSSDGQTLKTNYTWFNPGNRTAQGERILSRISGGPGLEGSWKVVKRTEEPDSFYIAFPAPGQLYIYIDPMDYTWAGPLDGTFRPVQCSQVAPGTASAFKLTGPRRMDIQTKIDDKLSYLEKWEISEDGKTLTRTTWPPGQENKTSIFILEKR
jgi:hypothetical protein